VERFEFTERDRKEMEERGISIQKVMAQIEIFKRGPRYVKLIRPCTLGDGIQAIADGQRDPLASCFDARGPAREVMKFVPASGAATRMFKTLLKFRHKSESIDRDPVAAGAAEGDQDCQFLLLFMDGIRRFAFYDHLASAMARDSLDAESLVRKGRYKEIVDYLLGPKGLDYARLPKGLILFHAYPDGKRTPFEEHLVEGAAYARRQNGDCHIHFTVSSEHQDDFEALFQKTRVPYEKEHNTSYFVSFSLQDPSTDTIAVDEENRPFRLNDGTLLFRPGGHGALIQNLNMLKGDMVFVKNIDNVVPDRLKNETLLWKKLLGGYFIKTQERLFQHLGQLTEARHDEAALREAWAFAEETLCLSRPHGDDARSASRDYLISLLNRPLRVCGMVKNEGEPGGGPFWVEGPDHTASLQVVESAQVDPTSEEQQAMLASATHFNPVDIVCGLQDFRGNPFGLERYVDPDAVFISHKSKQGRPLKALELPGLWNGGMARWNTLFVEVPAITFNPVKTVNDLLRKEHQ
jgi:hypothetical protein